MVALCPEPALAQRQCLDLAGWPHHRSRSARTGPGRPGRARPSAWRRCMAATATATAMARARAWSPPPIGDGGRWTLCAEAHGNGMACLPGCLEWSGRIIGSGSGSGSGHGIGIGKRRVQCVARPHACAMAGDPTHPSTRRCALDPSSCPCGSLVPQHSCRSHPPIHSPCPCAVRHR